MTNRRNTRAPQATIERGRDHEVIRPANHLKRRAAIVTNGPAGIDEAAIRRAEQALKALAPQFNGWMEEAARKLGERWHEARTKGFGDGRLTAFHRDAHDIRGQATTLGFPLCSRVGDSLCLLLEELTADMLEQEHVMVLVGQHVDAVRAITREGVIRTDNPVGGKLAAELELVANHMVAMARGGKPH
jgi:hypothetical protein